MKFYLIVAKGNKKGLPIPINIDLFMLGSGKMCQLRSKVLAPEHCALITRENKVFVRDMDSGQSTVVNGTAIPSGTEWPLHKGDKLEIGNLEFMIQFREKALSQRDLEEWAASSLDQNLERPMTEMDDDFHSPTNASEAAASIIDRLSVQRGQVKGRLRIGMENGVTTVRFNDSVLVEDGELAFIKQELCDHLRKPNLRVLLDFKNVMRMSTNAAAMLSEVNKWLMQWGSTMAVCRVRPDLQQTLAGMITDKFYFFPDKQAAFAAKW